MAIFDYKTGDFLRFLTQTCPPTEVTDIYIYADIYADIYIYRERDSKS